MAPTDISSFRYFSPDTIPVQIGTIILGALLLFAGRRLFWLFVAALGFVTATHFATSLIDPKNAGAILVVGVVAGVAGAVLAIFVQKVAVGLAGAVAGAYYLALFADAASLHELRWIAIVAGALVGALLMIVLFKWALIIFSSLAGAHLITTALQVTPQLAGVIFLILVLLGLVIQGRQLRSA